MPSDQSWQFHEKLKFKNITEDFLEQMRSILILDDSGVLNKKEERRCFWWVNSIKITEFFLMLSWMLSRILWQGNIISCLNDTSST